MMTDNDVWANFITYDDDSGAHPTPKFLLRKLINAKLWLQYTLADETNNAVQALTKDNFDTLFHKLSVGCINWTTVLNAIGNDGVSSCPSTSTLSPKKLLDN